MLSSPLPRDRSRWPGDLTSGGEVALVAGLALTRLFGLSALLCIPPLMPSVCTRPRSVVGFGADTATRGRAALGESSSGCVGVALPGLDLLAADRGVILPFPTVALSPSSSCRRRGASLGGSDLTVAVFDKVGLAAGVVVPATRGVSGDFAVLPVLPAASEGLKGRLLMLERSADIADPCYESHMWDLVLLLAPKTPTSGLPLDFRVCWLSNRR